MSDHNFIFAHCKCGAGVFIRGGQKPICEKCRERQLVLKGARLMKKKILREYHLTPKGKHENQNQD